MSRMSRGAAAAGGASAIVLFGAVDSAHASATLQQCLNQAASHNGVVPSCSHVNGTWVPSWYSDPGPAGGGIPSVFVFLFVIGLVIAVGVTIWKVSTAQRLARQSGMDPGLATRMTLLTDDGLDATYLAANLRQRGPSPDAPTPQSAPPTTPERNPTSASQRLTELTALRDQSLITDSEYEARRKAIIDSV